MDLVFMEFVFSEGDDDCSVKTPRPRRINQQSDPNATATR
jgi:hypothetical protein